ncbi:MAG: hypothetical protein K9K79_08095 [Desulfohalobiaceae bacterium]|nr:hypothetical protein [Desulfohalobiaceae bacterium]
MKHVPYAAVFPVKALGIGTVYLLHDLVEIAFRSFEQEMIMLCGHQTIGMADAIVVCQASFKNLQKDVSVLVIEKDGLSVVAPGGQVIESTGKFDAEWSSHEESIADKNLK